MYTQSFSTADADAQPARAPVVAPISVETAALQAHFDAVIAGCGVKYLMMNAPTSSLEAIEKAGAECSKPVDTKGWYSS